MNFVDFIITATSITSVVSLTYAVRQSNKAAASAQASAKWKRMHDIEEKQRKALSNALETSRNENRENYYESRAAYKALETLCKDLNVVRELEHKRSKLTAIKFCAKMPNLPQFLRTEFKLGVGPCGKNVTRLAWEEHSDHYMLTQWCEDGERKEFKYLKSELSGRIEKCITERQHLIKPLNADDLVRRARNELTNKWPHVGIHLRP